LAQKSSDARVTRDLFLRSALAWLELALGVGLVAGLAVLSAGEFSGSFAGWQFALAAHPKIAVVAQAATLCMFLVVTVFVRPPKAGSSPSAVSTWFSPSVELLAGLCSLADPAGDRAHPRGRVCATSQLAGHGRQVSAGVGTKVFWFFSSEKNSLPSCGRHRSFIFLQ